MGRGARDPPGHRGGEGFRGRGTRGSNDDRWDPPGTEEDPYRDPRDTYEDQQDPAADEYVWPTVEEEEDD